MLPLHQIRASPSSSWMTSQQCSLPPYLHSFTQQPLFLPLAHHQELVLMPSVTPSSTPSSSCPSTVPVALLFSSNYQRQAMAAPPPAIPPPLLRKKAHPSVRATAMMGCRRMLSKGWDLSGSVAGTSPLLRFEELDTTNMVLRQRIVFLGSQVDDMTVDLIISQLLFLDAEDQKKDIKLFINSPGEFVTAGMGIYDAMKLCKADVSTVCLGLATSMGAFLLASRSRGKGFCMPNARVTIHQPLGTAGGKTIEM